MKLLSEVREIVMKPVAKDIEVRLVIGDFNVNLMNKDFEKSAAYKPMEDAGYELALAPPAKPPADTNGYAGYFATHIRRRGVATGYTTDNLAAYYPGYSYIGSDHSINTLYAIDNAFTWYGKGTKKPASNEFTILNVLTGTLFQAGKPYGEGPKGSLAIKRILTLPKGAPPPAKAPKLTKQEKGLSNKFKSWEQYGRIRSTSDHLPIVFDI
jgi:hypothetical protein